ncbi:uncharacterized protein N7479_007003 [Penicillium vulpinum]|uniref:Uncharacterized protein n=1 Tax=Penicillium vulpinum TaxID=29845 RepID=A0A1V6S2Z4_9EURO|nr:uncharacterized protein N7479_007003 [Penicillium vulpinum]KAJ5959853.1 hypothetical protein N7479_007003 [Penicillium vulpinum]OQE08402.1 hypothetical protein PENVUL_c010G06405 [Penicillium vulpinum]
MYLIAFLTLLGFAAASADTNTTYWINPGDNTNKTSIAWNLGEQQVIVWNTDLSTFDVTLWQQDSGSVSTENTPHNRGTVYSQTDPQNKVSNITWVVQLYGNYVYNSSTFFFTIDSSGTSGYSSAFLL